MEKSESISFVQIFWQYVGLDGVIALISTTIALMVLFYLAFHSSKLSKHIDLPGAKLLKWSCLTLAIASIFSILFVFKFSEGENWVWPYIAYVVFTTAPLLTGAYGFATLVSALVAEKAEKERE